MGMKVRVVDGKSLLLGDNSFESGVITIPAGDTIKAGTFLKRDSGNSFSVVIDPSVTAPTAVMPTDLPNTSNATADFGFRACIAGKVRADMLRVNGRLPTDAEQDMIRNYGIIAVKISDLSRLDNGAINA